MEQCCGSTSRDELRRRNDSMEQKQSKGSRIKHSSQARWRTGKPGALQSDVTLASNYFSLVRYTLVSNYTVK